MVLLVLVGAVGAVGALRCVSGVFLVCLWCIYGVSSVVFPLSLLCSTDVCSSIRDTRFFLRNGVSRAECKPKPLFPFRDTGYFAQNGVSRKERKGEEERRAVACRYGRMQGFCPK